MPRVYSDQNCWYWPHIIKISIASFLIKYKSYRIFLNVFYLESQFALMKLFQIYWKLFQVLPNSDVIISRNSKFSLSKCTTYESPLVTTSNLSNSILHRMFLLSFLRLRPNREPIFQWQIEYQMVSRFQLNRHNWNLFVIFVLYKKITK